MLVEIFQNNGYGFELVFPSVRGIKDSYNWFFFFFLNLCVAFLWKYLVLLSPFLSLKIWARWFHILASLSSKILISNCNSWTRKLRPLCKASLLVSSNAFFFFSSSRLMFPNTFLFHHTKSLPQLSTLLMIEPLVSQVTQEFHTASIISPHPLLESHISSKWKIFFWGGRSKFVRLMRSGQWSDDRHDRW